MTAPSKRKELPSYSGASYLKPGMPFSDAIIFWGTDRLNKPGMAGSLSQHISDRAAPCEASSGDCHEHNKESA